MMKKLRSIGLAALLSMGMAGMGAPQTVMAQSGQQNPLLFEVLKRLDLLEQEIRQLRGNLEMYRYRQEQLERQLQASTGAAPGSAGQGVESRGWETAGGGPATGAAPGDAGQGLENQGWKTVDDGPAVGAQSAPPAAAPSGTEQADYDAAIRELQGGRYAQAITGFQGFLDAYPNSSLAGNAYYSLGESYYVTRDFARAKDIFNGLAAKYPNHEKLPDTLLKLSYIYSEQGDSVMAREMLENLVQRYSDSPAAVTARQRLESF